MICPDTQGCFVNSSNVFMFAAPHVRGAACILTVLDMKGQFAIGTSDSMHWRTPVRYKRRITPLQAHQLQIFAQRNLSAFLYVASFPWI